MGDPTAASRVKNVGRAVTIKRNGDNLYPGRRFVVNRHVRTLDSFLCDVTTGIRAPFGAVRQLRTPAGGTRVDTLAQLQPDKTYVACGMERFKPARYNEGMNRSRTLSKQLNTSGSKHLFPSSQLPALARPRDPVPARLRQITGPKIVKVFRNGDIHFQGIKLLLDRHTLTDFEQVLAVITQKVLLRTGAVRRLCNMEGQDVFGINELENGASYVAVGRGDRFLKVPYGSTNVKVLPKKTKPKLKPLHKPPKPKVPAVDEDGIKNDLSVGAISTVQLPQIERKRRDRPYAANLKMKKRSICGPPPQLFAVAGDTSLSVPPQKAMTPSVSRQSRHGDEEKSLKSLKKESASSSHLSAVSDLISPRSVKNNDPDSLSQEVSSLPDTTGAEPLPAGPSVFYSDGLPKGPEFSAGLEEAETYYAETSGGGVFNAGDKDEYRGEVVDDDADMVEDKPDNDEPEEIEEDLQELEPEVDLTAGRIVTSPPSATSTIPPLKVPLAISQPLFASTVTSEANDGRHPPVGREETEFDVAIDQASGMLDSFELSPDPKTPDRGESLEEVNMARSDNGSTVRLPNSVAKHSQDTEPSLQLPDDNLLIASQSAPAIINDTGATSSDKAATGLVTDRSTKSGLIPSAASRSKQKSPTPGGSKNISRAASSHRKTPAPAGSRNVSRAASSRRKSPPATSAKRQVDSSTPSLAVSKVPLSPRSRPVSSIRKSPVPSTTSRNVSRAASSRGPQKGSKGSVTPAPANSGNKGAPQGQSPHLAAEGRSERPQSSVTASGQQDPDASFSPDSLENTGNLDSGVADNGQANDA